MKRVFLGGTANNSTWREQLIPLLKDAGLDYFNPILPDGENWDETAQQKELNERASCDFCLYTITPKFSGVYAVAEAVDDSNKRPEKIIFCVLKNDDDTEFDDDQMKSLESVSLMIERNGGYCCTNLEAIVLYMYQSCDVTIETILEELPFSKFR